MEEVKSTGVPEHLLFIPAGSQLSGFFTTMPIEV